MVRKTLIHRIAEFIPRSPIISAAMTQNEAGGVVVTDEIMAILKGKPDGAEDGAPVDAPSASRLAALTWQVLKLGHWPAQTVYKVRRDERKQR